MNEDWLNSVRKKMADYEIDEPAGLWARIDTESRGALPGRMLGASSVWRRLKRWGAAAAIVAVALSAGWFFLKFGLEDASMDAEFVEGVDEPSFSKKEAVEVVNPGGYFAHESAVVPEQKHVSASREEATGEIDVPEPIREQTEAAEEEQRENVESDTPCVANDRSAQMYARAVNNTSSNRTTGDGGRFGLSLYTSGATGSRIMNSAYSGFNSSVIGANNAVWADDPALGMLVFNQGKSVSRDVRHRLPIRAGVSVSYSLSDRVALESGLIYSNLSSDITEGSDQYYYVAEQQLHYLGIPLKLRYKAISLWKIDAYATAGVTAEKCVSAGLSKQYVMENNTVSRMSEPLHEKPWQISALVAVGLQCNITDMLSVYAEPGISYYFDDASSLSTIYKDKPLNFNLDFGIRISFSGK